MFARRKIRLRDNVRKVSIAERLAATNGRPSGFDYLRLGLAVAIVAFHSVMTTYGRSVNDALLMSSLGPFLRTILPMFFALSGFLVAGSLERSKTILTFLGLRVIRIYPALAVEVALSAFLIGPAITMIPLASYFSDPLFTKYLLNVSGTIHYYLPGVFETNPYPKVVNLQLWTVPYELLCYVTLTALVLAGAVQRRILVPLAMPALALGELLFLRSPDAWGWRVYNGYQLVLCFLAGVSLYLYRDKITWSLSMFFAALAASLLLWYLPFGEYPAVLTTAYVTIYIGLTNLGRLSIIKGADYSYGIYLYGFVMQQLFVSLGGPRSWWINVLVCVPLSALVAALSWHFVEKPAQKLRQFLPAAERQYLAIKDHMFGWLAKQAGAVESEH
jgi:peptidoglycan/LPS O-acetylase OafA/YrhL